MAPVNDHQMQLADVWLLGTEAGERSFLRECKWDVSKPTPEQRGNVAVEYRTPPVGAEDIACPGIGEYQPNQA